jgi:hypothetical protein
LARPGALDASSRLPARHADRDPEPVRPRVGPRGDPGGAIRTMPRERRARVDMVWRYCVAQPFDAVDRHATGACSPSRDCRLEA